MKKIGIVGGLGPEATLDYYRIIIDTFERRQKGMYPVVIIYSLNITEFPHVDKERDKLIHWLINAVNSLYKAGADFGLIAAGTPHVVFDDVKALSPIPLLSIVEATCTVAERLKLRKVALLGTKITMSRDFFQKVFSEKGISLVVPTKQEQNYINTKLFTEIMFNTIVEDTRQGLLKIVKRMRDHESIEGVILGCTELPLILTKDEYGIPFLNTTRIHAESAVDYCLG